MSERSKGEDTTALFPTLWRDRAVPGRGADDASDFDGYHITGYSAWGGECGRAQLRREQTRCRDDEEGRRTEGLQQHLGNNDSSRITADGSAVWGRQDEGVRGPHQEPRRAGGARSRGERRLRFLVGERPPGDQLGKQGGPQLDQEGWGRGLGGVHAGAAREGSGRGGGLEPRLVVETHGAEPGG